jgi:hypothetical protein
MVSLNKVFRMFKNIVALIYYLHLNEVNKLYSCCKLYSCNFPIAEGIHINLRPQQPQTSHHDVGGDPPSISPRAEAARMQAIRLEERRRLFGATDTDESGMAIFSHQLLKQN